MLQPYSLRTLAVIFVLIILVPASYAQLPSVAQSNTMNLNRSAFRIPNRPAAATLSVSGTASAAAASVFPANFYQQKFDYNYGVSNGPGKLLFRDVDGDTKPEIISGASGSSVYVFKNNTTAGNISASSFPSPTTFVTGAANSVTVADMDGDNNPDLIDVSPTLDSIVILLNTPSGSLSQSSFSRRVSIPIPAPLPNDAHVIGTSDLDGDGHRDLVVSYISGSQEYVSFLRNNSTGPLTNTSFSLHLRLEYSFLTGGISIGDLDGDGKDDVVVSDNANNRISILRNASGTGYIAFALSISIPVAQLSTVALADIDGDGKKDLIAYAVRGTGDASLSLFRNSASAGLLTPASFGTATGFASGSGGFDTGDVDGDGKTDIVVSDTGKVSVFLNNTVPGSINATSLAPKADIPVSIRDLGAVTIGDLDKDGIAEIAVNYTTHNGNPTGGFFILQMTVPGGAPVINSISPLKGPVGSSVTISGFNFDPLATNDIVYFGSVRVPVTAASATSLTVTVPGGTQYKPVTVTNKTTGLTGYAAQSFITTFPNPFGVGVPTTIFNTVDNISQLQTQDRIGMFSDIDGDGRPDIVASATDWNRITFYRNRSTPGPLSSASFAAGFELSTGTTMTGFALGDIDGDGRNDLAITRATNLITVFRNISSAGNIGAASFAAGVDIPAGNGPASIAISDLDGDGKPDLVVTNTAGNSLSILRNTTTPGTTPVISFAQRIDISGFTSPRYLALGDLNGDNKPDIAVSNSTAGTVSVLQNNSSPGTLSGSTFTTIPVSLNGSNMQVYAGGLAIGDLDGDGKNDLTVTYNLFTSGSLAVLRNITNTAVSNPISFADKVLFPAGSSAGDVAIGDLDGDGRPDLVSTSGVSGNASVMINSASPGSITSTSFTSYLSFGSNQEPYSVSVGDLDLDGIPEIGLAGYSQFSILQVSKPTQGVVPAITAITPDKSNAGNAVTLAGSGFTSDAANIVYFGAVKATGSILSGTTLTVIVPAGATYGPVSVLNGATGLTGYSSALFTPTFSSASGVSITPAFYRPRIDFSVHSPVSGYLYSVAQGDLDGDGRTDMVVIHANSSTATVIHNLSGTGPVNANSFVEKFDVEVGANPLSVDIRDMDGDGKPDIIVTNNTPGTISILRNQIAGAGLQAYAFSARADIPVSSNSYPFSTAIADINLDGRPDLIVVNSVLNTVSVIRNNTSPGNISAALFGAKVDFTTGAGPRFVVARDLDNDNRPDLVIANEKDNTVSILRNQSTDRDLSSASFGSRVDFATGNGPTSLTVGDMDGDGKLDIATGNNAGNSISILRNTITTVGFDAGSFAAKLDFATPAQPFFITAGDANGDGKVDIVSANAGANSISVFQNKAVSGTIDASSFAKTDFATGVYPVSAAIGDLDGDGRAEITNLNAASGTLSVFGISQNSITPVVSQINPQQGPQGTAVVITGSNFNPALSGNTVFFGSVKAQVTLASASNLTVTVPAGATFQPVTVLNNSTRLQGASRKPFVTTFPNPAGTTGIPDSYIKNRKDVFTNSGPYSVAYSDLDGDGRSDLVVLNAYTSRFSILQNTTPPGSITGPTFAPLFDLSTGQDPRSIAVGDVNGDGRPDIVVANNTSSTVSVILNNSSPGTLSTSGFGSFVYSTGAHPYSVAIGDVDGDGKPEIVTASFDPANITVLTNNVAGGNLDDNSFAQKTFFAASAQPRFVAMGDLDGDGKTDLVVADQSTSLVSVLRNTSVTGTVNSASFAKPVNYSTGANPQGIALADIDGDNRNDICVANLGSASVSVLRNTSLTGVINESSFAAKADFATGDTPFSIAASDADGDGKIDLLTCNANPSKISILRNVSTAGSIGAGSFTRTDFNTGGYPVYIAAGDLDADGFPEIVTANVASNNISILNTRGAETTVPVITALSSYHAPAGSAVTITGSGFNATPSGNIVYFGSVKATVTGGNSNSLTVTVPTGASYKPVTVLNTQAGLAGTAPLDFGTTFLNPAGPGITTGFYRPKVDFSSLGLPYYVQLADMDGDGKPDMVIAGGSAAVSVRRNVSQTGTIDAGSFGDEVTFSGQGGFTLSVNDMDGDGRLDIVSMNGIGSLIGLYRNTSTPGTIAFGQTIELQTGNTVPVYTMVTGDLDGDGKPEIVYASTVSGGITIIKNNSAPGALAAASFSTRVSFPLPTGTAPRYLAIGDIDGDRKPEIVAVNQNTAELAIYRNTTVQGSLTNASFAARVNFTTGSQPTGVAISDMDGDNKRDVVVLNTGSSTLSVFRNTAVAGSITASSLAPAVNFATSPQSYALTVADADGDGKPDILTANAAAASMSVFRNTGSAGAIDPSSFAGRVDFPTGGYAVSVTTADADNDGIPEVVTTSTQGNNNNNTSVFKVNATAGFQAVSGGSNRQAATAAERAMAPVQLYPNPTRGEFTLAVPANQGVYSVEIVNLDGKLISRRSYNAGASGAGFSQRLSLLNQPAGTYWVKIIGTTGIRIQKVVLQQ